jgi:hypothetical protein
MKDRGGPLSENPVSAEADGDSIQRRLPSSWPLVDWDLIANIVTTYASCHKIHLHLTLCIEDQGELCDVILLYWELLGKIEKY